MIFFFFQNIYLSELKQFISLTFLHIITHKRDIT